MRRQEGTVRVRKREASDRHEGLRVVVLRQLAGARRGIEIANAHYGYFPIEGRIPLAPPSPSLFPLPRLFFLPRFSISRAHTHIHVHIPPLFFGFLSTVSVHLHLLSSRARYSASFAFYLAHPSLSSRPFLVALLSLSSCLSHPSRATNTRCDVRISFGHHPRSGHSYHESKCSPSSSIDKWALISIRGCIHIRTKRIEK